MQKHHYSPNIFVNFNVFHIHRLSCKDKSWHESSTIHTAALNDCHELKLCTSNLVVAMVFMGVEVLLPIALSATA
jgi:hypothetical protein